MSRGVGCGWTDDIDDTNTNNAGPVTCSPGYRHRATVHYPVSRNYSREAEQRISVTMIFVVVMRKQG